MKFKQISKGIKNPTKIPVYIYQKLYHKSAISDLYLNRMENKIIKLIREKTPKIFISFVFHIEPDKYVLPGIGSVLYEHSTYPYEFKCFIKLPNYLKEVFGNVKCTLTMSNPIISERQDIIRKLYNSGYEIGVHTHPHFRPRIDPKTQNKTRLSQFDWKWQYNFIKWHFEEIYNIIGKYPRTHVSGDFSFSKDTAKALNKIANDLNIPYIIDNSAVYGLNNPWTGPNVLWNSPDAIIGENYVVDINNPQKKGDSKVIEVFATSATHKTSLGKGIFINWINCTSLREMRWYFLSTTLNNFKKGNTNPIITYWGHNTDFFDGFVAPYARRNSEEKQKKNIVSMVKWLKAIPNIQIEPLTEINRGDIE